MKRVTSLFRQNPKWEIIGEYHFKNRLYEVDENGNFYRNKKLVTVKPDGANSLTVLLFDDNNVRLRYKIHQIVGQTFYKKEFKELHTIDHINRNRLDNRVENLRVADRQMQYSNRENIAYKVKKVLCLNNNEVYSSCQQAEKELNLVFNTVCRVARGERKSIHGYFFKYL